MSIAAVAAHEAGHAIVARRLGVGIAHVRAEGDGDGNTRTRYQLGSTPGQMMAAIAKLAIIDLAGPIAEQRHLARTCWAVDQENAKARAQQIVALQHGLEANTQLTGALFEEAESLLDEIQERASALVRKNWPEVERAAEALMTQGEMLEGDVDRLLAAEVENSP